MAHHALAIGFAFTRFTGGEGLRILGSSPKIAPQE